MQEILFQYSLDTYAILFWRLNSEYLAGAFSEWCEALSDDTFA